MDKGLVAINSDTFHFVPNASDVLEKTHNAIEPIGDQRIVLDVWTRDEIGIQIGAAFIEDLVVDDLERVVDGVSVHRSAFSFGLWIREVHYSENGAFAMMSAKLGAYLFSTQTTG